MSDYNDRSLNWQTLISLMRVSVEKGQNWKVISIPVRARNNVIHEKSFRVIVTPGHIDTHKKVIIALLYSVCRDNINLDCI